MLSATQYINVRTAIELAAKKTDGIECPVTHLYIIEGGKENPNDLRYTILGWMFGDFIGDNPAPELARYRPKFLLDLSAHCYDKGGMERVLEEEVDRPDSKYSVHHLGDANPLYNHSICDGFTQAIVMEEGGFPRILAHFFGPFAKINAAKFKTSLEEVA